MAGDVGDNPFAGTQLRRRWDGHELEMNGKVSRFEEGKRREASKSNAILAKNGWGHGGLLRLFAWCSQAGDKWGCRKAAICEAKRMRGDGRRKDGSAECV
jgi:hypothetical protein